MVRSVWNVFGIQKSDFGWVNRDGSFLYRLSQFKRESLENSRRGAQPAAQASERKTVVVERRKPG